MELFIPIESMVRRPGGLSVLGSLKATPFVRKVAAEWTDYRRTLKEAGRSGSIGSVPQIALDGANIAIEATISDRDATRKFLAGVLRGFAVTVDENSGQATMVTAVDNLDERVRDEIKLYKRGVTSMIDNEARAILKQYGIVVKGSYEESNSTSTAWTNPATGTNSASRGDGDDEPGYQPELDLLAAFIREFKIVVTELGASNENADLSPAEVIEQASRIAMQRVKQTNVTDRSADDGDDESLFPTSGGATATGAYRSAGDAIAQMFRGGPSNGFEAARRVAAANDLEAGLLVKLGDRNRVGIPGGADSLLKADHHDGTELRKLADARSGEVELSKILTEVGDEQLAKRLSERGEQGLRKTMDFSVFDSSPRAEDFAGSYDRGLADYGDPHAVLVKRLANRNRVGVSFEKLLH